MANIFDYKDYRKFLQDLVTKQGPKVFTQVELAKAMECQAAYLSQVLKERADLTEDHGVKLCQYLRLTEAETDYFLLILRWAKAGTPALRKYLEEARQKSHDLHREVESRISSVKNKELNEFNLYYCSSWIPAVLHSATSCESLQTVSSLMQRFGLEKEVVEHHLQHLERFGLVKFEKGRWIFQGGSLHFSKNSSMDQNFQMSRRLHAMNSIFTRQPEDIHYSTLLSVDAPTARKIRDLLINSIENIHKKAEPAPSEEIYSVCLDFFRA